MGFRTDIGPNSITEAGMFGSVDEEGNIISHDYEKCHPKSKCKAYNKCKDL